MAKLRRWLPPVAFDALKSRFGTHFSGNYASWAAAAAASVGYDAPAIAERVRDATRRVVRGEAAFERDSLVFEEMEHPWPLVTCLLLIAMRRENSLNVVDFGGSLGSTYRQCASLLRGLQRVSWTVVEQPTFVDIGRREFTTEELSFSTDLDRVLREQRPDVVLFSSVLQYLPEPYAVLDSVAASGVPFVLLDRLPLIAAPEDRLTVQTVSKRVYGGSYPAWFFSREQFLKHLSGKYRVTLTLPGTDRANVESAFVGMLLERED